MEMSKKQENEYLLEALEDAKHNLLEKQSYYYRTLDKIEEKLQKIDLSIDTIKSTQ